MDCKLRTACSGKQNFGHQIRARSVRQRVKGTCDDILNDRSEGSELDKAWDNTCKLWKLQISKDGLASPAAMFRGNGTAEERALRPAIQASAAKIAYQYSQALQGNTAFVVAHKMSSY